MNKATTSDNYSKITKCGCSTSQPFAGAQVSRVLRCRESDPGYDHTMSADELSFD
jgi:hypothetical protein